VRLPRLRDTAARLPRTSARSPLDNRTREGHYHPARLFLRFLTDQGEKLAINMNGPSWVDFPRPARTVSGLIGISGFEERQFKGDRSTKEVAAQVRVARADTVQLRA
jgi:hypothetical protein